MSFEVESPKMQEFVVIASKKDHKSKSEKWTLAATKKYFSSSLSLSLSLSHSHTQTLSLSLSLTHTPWHEHFCLSAWGQFVFLITSSVLTLSTLSNAATVPRLDLWFVSVHMLLKVQAGHFRFCKNICSFHFSLALTNAKWFGQIFFSLSYGPSSSQAIHQPVGIVFSSTQDCNFVIFVISGRPYLAKIWPCS